jgi:hypothetical protein
VWRDYLPKALVFAVSEHVPLPGLMRVPFCPLVNEGSILVSTGSQVGRLNNLQSVKGQCKMEEM